MEPREYTILDVKKGDQWGNTYGQFQAYALALVGVGEPVKLNKKLPVASDPVKGDKLYGHLEQEVAASGKEYYKFKSDSRPESDSKQQSIQAQFAIRTAVDVWIAQGCDTKAYSNILTEAKHFYAMINQVKEENE
jgi:ABC-type sugar transport system substrate-binding protein